MPAFRPATSTRSCSAISTPASRRRISPPRWCCRPTRSCASSRRPASRTPAPPAPPPSIRAMRAIAAGAARIVLVVGVEQMTAHAGAGDRQEPAQGVLSAGGRRHRRRLRRRVRQDRQLLFPEIRRPVRRAGDDRGQEPQERRRQSLRPDAQGFRLRVLPRREREEPLRRRSAEAHRLLAGLGRRRRAGAGRCRDRASAWASRSASAPPRTPRISCRCRSATSSSSRAARSPGSARWRRRA